MVKTGNGNELEDQTDTIRINLLEEQIHELINRVDKLTQTVARCARNTIFDCSNDWRY